MSSLSHYPPSLRASTANPKIVYTRAEGYHAVRIPASSHQQNTAESRIAVLEDDGEAYQIFEGEPRTSPDKATAVYRCEDGNILCVPTGRVFVRLEEGLRAEDFKVTFHNLGFVITRLLPYAPHAAWLARQDDDIAAALCNLGALEQLPHVCNVEPQLLSVRTWR